VTHVTSQGAGIWAPDIDQMLYALKNWLQYPDQRAQAVRACERLARPQAARDIARTIAKFVPTEIKKTNP